MDKETLSNYGWIVICVLVLAVMIALAGPFGTFVAGAVKSTTAGLFSVNQNALGAAGIELGDQAFADDGNGGTGNQGGTGLPAVGTSAEDCTWDEIKAISEAGKGDEYFNLGDTKTITTTDGKTIVMEIVAFNADTKTDGTGTTGITWMSKGVLIKRPMNSAFSNNGGWAVAELRTWLQGDFYNTMPSDTKNAIVQVSKSFYNPTTKTTESCNDTIWVPSIGEIFGNNYDSYGCEASGVNYTSYYGNISNRIKYDSNGTACYWWLRSGCGSDTFCFRGVKGTGDATIAGTPPANSSTVYVVFGFCT